MRIYKVIVVDGNIIDYEYMSDTRSLLVLNKIVSKMGYSLLNNSDAVMIDNNGGTLAYVKRTRVAEQHVYIVNIDYDRYDIESMYFRLIEELKVHIRDTKINTVLK